MQPKRAAGCRRRCKPTCGTCANLLGSSSLDAEIACASKARPPAAKAPTASQPEPVNPDSWEFTAGAWRLKTFRILVLAASISH